MRDKKLIGAEIERLRKAHKGTFDAEDLVKAAAPVTSPLHNYFEWDDAKAGHQYRVEQARLLLKIVIAPMQVQGNAVIVPLYVSEVQPSGDRAYASVVEILTDKQRTFNMAKETLQRARDVLKNCPHKVTQQYAKQLDKEINTLKP